MARMKGIFAGQKYCPTCWPRDKWSLIQRFCSTSRLKIGFRDFPPSRLKSCLPRPLPTLTMSLCCGCTKTSLSPAHTRLWSRLHRDQDLAWRFDSTSRRHLVEPRIFQTQVLADRANDSRPEQSSVSGARYSIRRPPASTAATPRRAPSSCNSPSRLFVPAPNAPFRARSISIKSNSERNHLPRLGERSSGSYRLKK